MPDKILVTGGAGFIGSHVAEELIARGGDVLVLDDLSGGFLGNVPRGARFIKGNILDTALIERIFKKYKFKYVFHMAAYAAEGLSHFIKKFNYENNLIGSINLINASVNHKVKCFAFTSSIAVYGENQLPMTEALTPCPEDSYGISKLAVEQELHASKRLFGLDYIIFRPHNVYGERQNIRDKYRNVIGIFMNQIMMGKPLTIFGDGKQTRAFTYIKDISQVMAGSLFNRKVYGQVFNIGADKPYSVNELAEKVCCSMGLPQCEVRHLPSRLEVKYAFSSHNKMRKFFAYKPKYSLEEGLAVMASWARTAKCGPTKKFKNIEITKNLPKGWL